MFYKVFITIHVGILKISKKFMNFWITPRKCDGPTERHHFFEKEGDKFYWRLDTLLIVLVHCTHPQYYLSTYEVSS
jgi:hypothetical protein